MIYGKSNFKGIAKHVATRTSIQVHVRLQYVLYVFVPGYASLYVYVYKQTHV
jgi:hypothetical protein